MKGHMRGKFGDGGAHVHLKHRLRKEMVRAGLVKKYY